LKDAGYDYISKEPVTSVSKHSSTLKNEATLFSETSIHVEKLTTGTDHKQYMNTKE
jgi:hypothetical protein